MANLVSELVENELFRMHVEEGRPLRDIKVHWQNAYSPGTIARAYHAIKDVEPETSEEHSMTLSSGVQQAASEALRIAKNDKDDALYAILNGTVEMPAKEARSLTEQVKQNTQYNTNALLKIYNERGWKSLGYATWEEYGNTEFQVGRREMLDKVKCAQVRANLDRVGEISPISKLESAKIPFPHLIPDTHLLAVADLAPADQPFALAKAYSIPEKRIVPDKPSGYVQFNKKPTVHDVEAAAAAYRPIDPPKPERESSYRKKEPEETQKVALSFHYNKQEKRLRFQSSGKGIADMFLQEILSEIPIEDIEAWFTDSRDKGEIIS